MNGRRPNFLEFVSRLPPRIWLQAALGLIGFAVLAVLGFAVIAVGATWLTSTFAGMRLAAPLLLAVLLPLNVLALRGLQWRWFGPRCEPTFSSLTQMAARGA